MQIAINGKLLRFWVFECSSHGKGPYYPEGGVLNNQIDSVNAANIAGKTF